MSEEKRVLTKKDVIKSGKRFFIGVSTFNYETQMAPSVTFALYPLLKKIYGDDQEKLKKSVLNQTKYFNTHPWIANLVLGAALGIEDEGKIDSLDAVQDIKVGLMGPLAGVGDTLIWAMCPTIFGSIAASMALNGSSVGAWIWVIFFGLSLLFRPQLMWLGYKQGAKLFSQLGSKLTIFTESVSILGLTVIGAILPTSIKMVTGIKYINGDVSLDLQETLNSLVPALLPIILVIALYYLMGKRKIKMTHIILFLIVFSMICAYFGILTV